MTRAAPSISRRQGAMPVPIFAPPNSFPTLARRDLVGPEPADARRTRLWEFNTNLHCSIVGTCLTTGELRQILTRLGLAAPTATDHDLHGTAVTLASRHDPASKRLHKALDQHHRLVINRFAKARSEPEVGTLWRERVKQGDIPGAYWAVLTHPATTPALIREAFGEVHMLSHLLGAANRADIRRLSVLEQERAELQERVDRQQVQLHKSIVTRDSQIRDLRSALAARLGSDEAAAPAVADATLPQLVADLERRLAIETNRRLAVERRLAASQARVEDARSACVAAEQEAARLRAELDALEGGLDFADGNTSVPPDLRLNGISILYVGGRRGDIPRLRALVERVGAALLHHDGGMEESSDRLAALAARADLVLFPVDCISHPATLMIKRLCRQAGKRYVPLRSSGATSFLAALGRPEVIETACRSRQASAG